MLSALIAAHVVAAILLVGPITVAASRFPRNARAAAGAAPEQIAVASEAHRVTRAYAAASVVVPALGIGVAADEHAFSQRWLMLSIGLTVVGAALLAGVVVPAQARALDIFRRGEPVADVRLAAARAGAAAGVFGAVWVAVVVLMVVQPRLGQ